MIFIFKVNFKWDNTKPVYNDISIKFTNSSGAVFKLGSSVAIYKVVKSQVFLPIKIIE